MFICKRELSLQSLFSNNKSTFAFDSSQTMINGRRLIMRELFCQL